MPTPEVIKAIIVDDETHCTESLSLQLTAQNVPVHILGRFTDPHQALTFMQHETFDIAFLDIEMPGLNGFDLLNQLPHFSFDVVFTTAYNQYAIKAFQYSALSYLLKPVDETDLREVLDRWQEKNQKKLQVQQFNFLLDLLKSSPFTQSKVALPTADGLEFIEISRIIRCQSESNYTHVYLQGGSSYLICRTLKDVETILGQHGFLRIHQSHLINPHHLKKFVRSDGGSVIMSDETQVSISKANRHLISKIVNDIDRL